MAPSSKPPPQPPAPIHTGSSEPLQVILTGRPGGPGSPGWPCKSNGRGSEAGGLLGPCSSLLQPLPDSGSPLPVLSPQQALTLTPGVPTGPGSPLAPVRPWGRKKVDQ